MSIPLNTLFLRFHHIKWFVGNGFVLSSSFKLLQNAYIKPLKCFKRSYSSDVYANALTYSSIPQHVTVSKHVVSTGIQSCLPDLIRRRIHSLTIEFHAHHQQHSLLRIRNLNEPNVLTALTASFNCKRPYSINFGIIKRHTHMYTHLVPASASPLRPKTILWVDLIELRTGPWLQSTGDVLR